MMLDLKTRQLSIRYLLDVIKTYFGKTIFTKYDAIVGTPISSLCCRYLRNGVRLSQTNIGTTPSTPRPKSVLFILSKTSVINSSISKSHSNIPPIYTWRKDPYWWRYYCDNTYTGIAVETITELKITPYKTVKVKEPSYRILFNPPNDNRVYDMIECQSLKKAQNLAEWYYSEWESVNHKILDEIGVNQ